jgi:hypothetical protein
MLGMLVASNLLPCPGERLLEVISGAGIPGLAEIDRDAFRLGEEALKGVQTS